MNCEDEPIHYNLMVCEYSIGEGRREYLFEQGKDDSHLFETGKFLDTVAFAYALRICPNLSLIG